MNEDRIEELVEKWEEEFEKGRDVPIEKLCRDDPALKIVVQARIAALKEMKWMDYSESCGYSENPGSSNEKTVFGESALIENRYRLDTVVGEGAFGIVWKGFDEQLQRLVALKIPKHGHQFDQKEVEAFREEARKLARLKRHGIVPVYDIVRHGGAYVIVSEFIEGKNLSEYLKEHHISGREAVDRIASLARRFDYAHRHGMVHRDIKPANILVSIRREFFIADFGIASTLEPGGTPSDQDRRGTLPYMAPELLKSTPGCADARSDIYSLGVMFYQLLTGRLPFISRSSERLRNKILNDPITPPGAIVSLPSAVEAICLKCLARDPNDRYQTMAELASVLKPCQKRRNNQQVEIPFELNGVGFWCMLTIGVSLSMANGLYQLSFWYSTLYWPMALFVVNFMGYSVKNIGEAVDSSNSREPIKPQQVPPHDVDLAEDEFGFEPGELEKLRDDPLWYVIQGKKWQPTLPQIQNPAVKSVKMFFSALGHFCLLIFLMLCSVMAAGIVMMVVGGLASLWR